MTAIAGTVASKYHRLATEHPLGIALVVAALGQVVHLAVATGIDQGNVLAVPAALTDVGRQQPTAVGTPLIPHVTVAIGVDVFAVHQGAHSLALHIDRPQCGTVFEESDALAVGTVGGLDAGLARVGQLFFHQVGGIGELLLVLVFDAGLVNLPHSAALAVIDDAAAIGREIDGAFLLGSVGDLLGGLVIDRGDIHIAVHDKSHFLAAGRHADGCCSAGLDLAHKVLIIDIGSDGDINLTGLPTLLQGVDFTVIAVT